MTGQATLGTRIIRWPRQSAATRCAWRPELPHAVQCPKADWFVARCERPNVFTLLRWHDERRCAPLLPQRVFLGAAACDPTFSVWYRVTTHGRVATMLCRVTQQWQFCACCSSLMPVAAVRACPPHAATCAACPRILGGGWAVVSAAGSRAHPARVLSPRLALSPVRIPLCACACVCCRLCRRAHARAHAHKHFLSAHAYTLTRHTSAHTTHTSTLTRAESLVALAAWCTAGSCKA